ncbi:MAG: TetR/AcrR family transcriptional regulator [Anaerolineae bacterium]|nr:TetR/AcrR family transcriptional regulator [Anaerolineae bacterium]
MSRTRQPERKEKFLSAALKLFAANGVQQTSTAEIAKEAGAAVGTLFLYFPTKQDLIHALVIKISKEQAESIHARIEPSLSVRETFFAIWNGSLCWFLEHIEAFLYIQQIRDSGILAEAVVQESGKFFDYYYDAIQKGLAEGLIKPYPAELIGGILYQNIVAVMNLIRVQPDPNIQAQYIQQGFEIFWNGIKQAEENDEI